jgi:hypothetical protein
MDGWIQETSEPAESPNNSVAHRPLKDGWLSPGAREVLYWQMMRDRCN